MSDRAKLSRIVLRREVTKARRNEAECKRSVEAHILTMLWEVMTVNHDSRSYFRRKLHGVIFEENYVELFSEKITPMCSSTGSHMNG